MCTVCGCGEGDVRIESSAESGHGHDHAHEHSHDHHHEHGHVHHYGHGPARAHAPGLSQARMVEIEENILDKNNQYAGANRQWLREHGVLALNLVSSPGSGRLIVESGSTPRRSRSARASRVRARWGSCRTAATARMRSTRG